ncbi:hypothetical protein [Nevskia sp.]|uniref:hypothetical protein n=1 Tax=Nevskia sp. TaxID=1929292 RepID=UPI0025DE6488|nr:hypothetical protein [Nevskia sp.]
MSIPPAASRPPAPTIVPVEHDGIRYEQGKTDERRGDQAGGYLTAFNAQNGMQLWRVKVYEVADHRAAGVSSGAIHFRTMMLSGDYSAILIENEVGSRFSVDLTSRRVEFLGGTPLTAEPVPANPTVKPKPKP